MCHKSHRESGWRTSVRAQWGWIDRLHPLVRKAERFADDPSWDCSGNAKRPRRRVCSGAWILQSFRLIRSSLTGFATAILWLVQKTIDETPLYSPILFGRICRYSGDYSRRVHKSSVCERRLCEALPSGPNKTEPACWLRCSVVLHQNFAEWV